jgi:hypothetical protein
MHQFLQSTFCATNVAAHKSAPQVKFFVRHKHSSEGAVTNLKKNTAAEKNHLRPHLSRHRNSRQRNGFCAAIALIWIAAHQIWAQPIDDDPVMRARGLSQICDNELIAIRFFQYLERAGRGGMEHAIRVTADRSRVARCYRDLSKPT